MSKSLYNSSAGASLILSRVAAAVKKSKKCIKRLESLSTLSNSDRNFLRYGYQECVEVIGFMTPAITSYYSDRLAREIDSVIDPDEAILSDNEEDEDVNRSSSPRTIATLFETTPMTTTTTTTEAPPPTTTTTEAPPMTTTNETTPQTTTQITSL